ncbi:hypothetical protein EDD15DRAFT_2371749 [Pisolithus albus]|nr:hypothetical protein EDD15DRAFT_2371749 [Pisolithus albus]
MAVTLEELEDRPEDSTAIRMAKFDKRQHCQHMALQQEIKAEECKKAKEAMKVQKTLEAEAWKKAEEKRIRELEAEWRKLEEKTRQAQQSMGSSSQQVPASTGKAIEKSSRSYPTWSKCYLDESGNLNRMTCDTIKEEAADEEEDFQDHSLSGKKWKGHTETGSLHNKKPKGEANEHVIIIFTGRLSHVVETPSTVDTPKVVTVPQSNQPTLLPEEVAEKQLDLHQVSAIPSDKENLPVVSDVTQPSISYNPMSLLAVAVDKVKMIPLPPIPESSIKYDSVPMHAPEAKHSMELSSDASKRTKFRPSGMKNGQCGNTEDSTPNPKISQIFCPINPFSREWPISLDALG